MTFSLSDVHDGIKNKPRKVILYGTPKLGKSTLAASAKNALLIYTEDRVDHIDCKKTPLITSYDELQEVFNFLLSGKHTFKRIIVDTLDWLEPLIHQKVCESKGFSSITDDYNKDTAYSRGLKYHAVEGWKIFLHNCDALREAGMDIILVAHSTQITKNPPDKDPYDKYVMKVDKNALPIIEEWGDVIAFYDQDIFVTTEKTGANKKTGKATSANSRSLYLSGKNPAMMSGNSFGLGDVTVELKDCSEIMEWILTESNN